MNLFLSRLTGRLHSTDKMERNMIAQEGLK